MIRMMLELDPLKGVPPGGRGGSVVSTMIDFLAVKMQYPMQLARVKEPRQVGQFSRTIAW